MSHERRLFVLLLALTAALGTRPCFASDPAAPLRWNGKCQFLEPKTPDHPGHETTDANGIPFYRLDPVEDGASVIGTVLDLTSSRSRWLEVTTEVRGEDARGIAGLGYRVLGETDGVLATGFDYPPCPKNPRSWTRCSSFVEIPPNAHKLNVFLSASFSSRLDVLAVDVRPVHEKHLVKPRRAVAIRMERIFTAIKSGFFLSAGIDWRRVHEHCMPHRIPPAYDPTIPFVRCVVDDLDDPHTRIFRKPNGATERPPRPEHDVRLLATGVGYLKLADAAVDPGHERLDYSDAASEKITELLAQGATDWVVDLRGNRGGNVFALLAAVAPLITPDSRPLAYWEDARGVTTPLRLSSRGIEEGSSIRVHIDPERAMARGRLIVLLDKGCLSSCEILATMLESQKCTTLMGQPTGGLNTSVDEFDLRDPYKLALTTAYVRDAAGRRRYPNVIPAVLRTDNGESWLAAAQDFLQSTRTGSCFSMR